MADASSGSNSTPPADESEADKEVRLAKEAHDAWVAAQAKVDARAKETRQAQIAPYKTLISDKSYPGAEAAITKLIQTDGAMFDRNLFSMAQTAQDALRILRETVESRVAMDA